MSLSKNSPDLLLDKITIWGNPRHGRADLAAPGSFPAGWRVTLPNGAVQTPAPLIGEVVVTGGDLPSGYLYPAMMGFNSLFARPDMPEIERTPELLAQDAAAGLEWRNKAIIHRPEMIGGSPNWIWCDSTGARWLVAAIFKAAELEVRIRRFGAFGHPEPSGMTLYKYYPWSLALAGQDTTLPEPYADTDMRYRLHDRTATGDRAVVMIHLAPPSSFFDRPVQLDPAIASGSRYISTLLPIGFLEVTMTGAPDAGDWGATVSVLSTRAQTIGTVNVQTWQAARERHHEVTAIIDPPYPHSLTGLAGTQTITLTATDNAGGTPVNNVYTNSYVRGKAGNQVTVTGRVFSMHYEEGALVTLTGDWVYKDTIDEDTTFAVGGTAYRDYVREAEDKGWEFVEQRGAVWIDATYQAISEWSEHLTLKKNGVSFSQWQTGRYSTELKTARSNYLPEFVGTQVISESHSGSWRYITNGAVFEPTIDWGVIETIYGYAGGPAHAPAALTPEPAIWLWGPVTGRPMPGAPIVDAGSQTRFWRRSVVYHAQHCIGYIARGDESTGTQTALAIGEICTPSGTQPAIPRTLYSLPARPLVFASYNPVTGDFARSAWPVNWS